MICPTVLWLNHLNIALWRKVHELYSDLFTGMQTCFRRDLFIAVTSDMSPSYPPLMVIGNFWLEALTLARLPYFATFPVQGGCDPPGVSKLSVVELSEKKTADCSRRVLAIDSAFFYPRSKMDPVLGGQRS